jgi:hypothetical protein
MKRLESRRGTALDRAERNADPVGDLTLRETLEIRQDEDFPVLLRYLRESLGHVPPVYLLLGLRTTGDRTRRILPGGGGPHLPPASQIHRPVAGDPV